MVTHPPEEAAATPRMFPTGPDCPACRAVDAKPILYGLPTHEAMLEAYRGDAVLGACTLIGDESAFECRACEHRFGRHGDHQPTRAERVGR